MKQPKTLTKEQALSYAASLCAGAEQCEADIRQKLSRHSVSNADADEVIDYLYTHRFLDEARFSRAYARDKARFAKWGRNKIIINLKAKQISSENIRYALQEIPQEEYMDILLATTRTLARGLNLAAYTDRAKLYRKLATRGYTASEISQALARLQADS